jgi:hypothetical protein
MSFMAKIAAGAATFALAGGGLGMVGTLTASAATPSCGPTCDSWYTQKFNQAYVLDDLYGQASAGNALILFQASNSDPAEDFVTVELGSVGDLYGHQGHHGHMNSPGYGISPGFARAYGRNPAIEIRYEPLGQDSKLCVGTWPGENAQPGFKIRLETCGEANTLFAKPVPHRHGPRQGDTGDDRTTYVPLITGTDTNFSTPLVLNYPEGNPTDLPRPWLNVQPLSSYAGRPPTVYDSQLWADKMGVLP